MPARESSEAATDQHKHLGWRNTDSKTHFWGGRLKFLEDQTRSLLKIHRLQNRLNKGDTMHACVCVYTCMQEYWQLACTRECVCLSISLCVYTQGRPRQIRARWGVGRDTTVHSHCSLFWRDLSPLPPVQTLKKKKNAHTCVHSHTCKVVPCPLMRA